jgi:hypothetical protein
MDRFLLQHPDLEQVIAAWVKTHPDGIEADAITELGLWPRSGDKDAQWLVWRELRKVKPIAAPAIRARSRPGTGRTTQDQHCQPARRNEQ